MLLVLAGDVAEAQGSGVQFEVAVIGSDQGTVQLGVILGADVDLVFTGDAGLLLNPIGLTGCLSIPHRATDASPWTKGRCDAEVELFAFDFAGVRHRGDVQVAADTANNLIAAQGGTADVGVFATGEAQTVARVEVGFLLSATFPIKIALADVHADVDAYALRPERQAPSPPPLCRLLSLSLAFCADLMFNSLPASSAISRPALT